MVCCCVLLGRWLLYLSCRWAARRRSHRRRIPRPDGGRDPGSMARCDGTAPWTGGRRPAADVLRGEEAVRSAPVLVLRYGAFDGSPVRRALTVLAHFLRGGDKFVQLVDECLPQFHHGVRVHAPQLVQIVSRRLSVRKGSGRATFRTVSPGDRRRRRGSGAARGRARMRVHTVPRGSPSHGLFFFSLPARLRTRTGRSSTPRLHFNNNK